MPERQHIITHTNYLYINYINGIDLKNYANGIINQTEIYTSGYTRTNNYHKYNDRNIICRLIIGTNNTNNNYNVILFDVNEVSITNNTTNVNEDLKINDGTFQELIDNSYPITDNDKNPLEGNIYYFSFLDGLDD